MPHDYTLMIIVNFPVLDLRLILLHLGDNGSEFYGLVSLGCNHETHGTLKYYMGQSWISYFDLVKQALVWWPC